MKSRFYITTTLPYVNADPHVGFALEIIQADVIVRYQRLLGKEVFYNTGTDEHGLKIYRKALEKQLEPQSYCDELAERFRDLATLLNLAQPTFIRTTDVHHGKAAQEFWRRCAAKGDIYKKNYQIKYCVGCELEKTDSELAAGRCPIHPSQTLELINEKNYFFRFSRYQSLLLDYYNKASNFVVPRSRFNEIKELVKNGLEDFSISRLKAKMPWGVPVPGDLDHVMYVWFDALINYISTLGWPEDQKKFTKFWGTADKPNAIQVAGKDNLRQQTAMWQAMLMSAGLPPSKQVFIHGFITTEGKKMSKGEGNVVDPRQLVKKYGVDAVRYYLLGALPAYEDGNFSLSEFTAYYTAHLVHGVGNLTSRILSMLEKYSNQRVPSMAKDVFNLPEFWLNFDTALAEYRFDAAVKLTQELASRCDQKINEQRPWERGGAATGNSSLLYQLAETLRHIALALLPIIPESAEKIFAQLGVEVQKLSTLKKEREWGRLTKDGIIKKVEVLFARLG